MTPNLTTLLVPTFTQMLRSLSTWLDKAPPAELQALLSARLAPDMYPLASQIRFACFQALEPLFRLRGVPLPSSLLQLRTDGWNPDTAPAEIETLQACIRAALEQLDTVAAESLDGAAERPVALDLPNGLIFDMTGETYARDWALPQFYFHVMTAYAILRSRGVDLGKADYVSHMLAYLRPGTAPLTGA